MYLAAVLDLVSRRIVGWSMCTRINAELVCQPLRSVCLQRRAPPELVLHSDRAILPPSIPGQGQILGHNRGNESASQGLGRRVPGESLQEPKGRADFQTRYETRAHARVDIADWIEGYYNLQRLHSSIGYRVPVLIEVMLPAE